MWNVITQRSLRLPSKWCTSISSFPSSISFSPILLLPVIMLGCTLWHPASGTELRAHNGMEQQAGRCWFHSGRTQMAGKHSSACGTGFRPIKLKSSWFSFRSVCCWKEVEAWKLHDISHQTKLTTRRVRRQSQSPTCPHFGVAAKPEEDKVLSKTSSISSARHSWKDRNSHVRHTTSSENRLKCSNCAKRIAFIILEANQMIFFSFLLHLHCNQKWL